MKKIYLILFLAISYAASAQVGSTCGNPMMITSLPYTNTGLTTCGFGDDYSSADLCGSSYMNGDDFVFGYQPTSDECIKIDLSNTGTWVGVFVTQGCPSSAMGTCIASGTSSSGNPSVTASLTGGNNYAITISTFPSPQCTAFDISVDACPPPPANDDCSGAVALTVNADQNCGTVTSGYVDDATGSTDPTSETCSGTADDDVWYSFVATGSQHTVSLINISGTTTDMYHAVFAEGMGCPSLGAEIMCNDGNTSNLTGLSAGSTYYVRVYTWTSTAGQSTSFDICVGTPPPPPANDDCSGAISLTVNSDENCGSVRSGTVQSATQSSQSTTSCSGTEDDDVWYSFVATSTAHTIELLNISGSTTDMYHSVWEGSCPSLSLVSGTCSDPNTQTVGGLTVGNTYYIRVYTYTSTTGQTTNFDICVGTPPPPPSNDECSGAISLTVNPNGSCATTTSATAEDATNSGVSACTGTPSDDVWFSFVAPASGSINVTISNATGTTDMVHEVFENTCGSLNSLGCSDPNTSTTGGLTAGDTYYVRVHTYSSTGNNTGFDICLAAGPTAGVSCYSQSNPSWPGLVNGSFALSPGDDEFEATGRNVTFDFCFMGNLYNVMYVSSNGYISFDAANMNGSSSWVTETIPNTDQDVLNSIMSPWHDIDPGVSGDIRKRNVGTAPNRSVEITFNNIPLFSSSCNTGPTQRHMIVLYETSNVIDIRIEDKTVCTSWNNGDATMGLNGPLGLAAVTVAGRNDQNWTASNEVTRFTPTCDVCPVALGSGEYSYFDARNLGNVNEIMWGTYFEDDVKHFEVQRSFDAVKYETIAKVKSKFGTTDAETQYVFMDNDPKQGNNYYRIKRMNQNDEYKFTQFKNAIVDLESKPNIYPNPTKDILNIEFVNSLDNEGATFEIVDIIGKVVYTHTLEGKKGIVKDRIDVSTLSPGVYYYRTLINSKIESGKLIIE